ncbi:hypothetical protein AB0A81_13980 [Streptomyces flaveolus]|uniref:Uncharacterized protein n=1 Tax=Streptomyces flaveolus TaxID=67297 RepID=A0ABV1V8H8_9ACTN
MTPRDLPVGSADEPPNERVRGVACRPAGAGAAALVCWMPARAAHADETTTGSHDGPRAGLLDVHVGQVDDPMEDVLEHTLLFGDGYTWN